MKNLFTLLLLCACAVLHAQVLDETFPKVNGAISCMAKAPGKDVLYIAGDFDWIGPDNAYGALLDVATGVAKKHPKVNGEVYSVVADGAGGWYIGGDFTQVGTLPRAHLAHIDAAGIVTSFSPDPDDIVRDIKLSGNDVYIAGDFKNVGGTMRRGVAAISKNGIVTGWNPASDGDIYRLLIAGGAVYVSGQFTTIGGQPRTYIAAVDPVTANATAFNPLLNEHVYAMAAIGDSLYVGGSFTTVNGQPRERLASFNMLSGGLTSFSMTIDKSVVALTANAHVLYVGGFFDFFGGKFRTGCAAINTNTMQLTNWYPYINYFIGSHGCSAITIHDSVAYIGGYFSSVAGNDHMHIAAVDTVNGLPLSWPVAATEKVSCIAVAGNDMYVGGMFESVGEMKMRAGLAAIDCKTKTVTDWYPNVQKLGQYGSLAASGNTVYLGGWIDGVDFISRKNLAAVDATTGALTAFYPQVVSLNQKYGPPVRSIVVKDGIIYISGEFTDIGAFKRRNIAAIDSATGVATAWEANADAAVTTLHVSDDVLYAGGRFAVINGAARKGLAAIGIQSGNVTSWDPAINTTGGIVEKICSNDDKIYVGGSFTAMGGKDRQSIAELDVKTGLATAWDAQLDSGEVKSIVIGHHMYLAGSVFLPGKALQGVSSVDVRTAAGISWDPQIPYEIGSAMVLDGDKMYLNNWGSASKRNLMVYTLPATTNVEEGSSTTLHPLAIHPNPSVDGNFTCTFSSTKTQILQLTVTDITGKVLHTQKVNVVNGKNTVHINAAQLSGSQLLMVNLPGIGVGKLLMQHEN